MHILLRSIGRLLLAVGLLSVIAPFTVSEGDVREGRVLPAVYQVSPFVSLGLVAVGAVLVVRWRRRGEE